MKHCGSQYPCLAGRQVDLRFLNNPILLVVRRSIRIWDKFWFSRFDPLSLGVFRIALGILIMTWYLALYVNWEEYYGKLGNIWLYETHAITSYSSWLNVFRWTKDLIPIRVFWWSGFLSAAAFTAGWRTKLFAIILFIMQSSIINQNIMLVNGEDSVFRMFLFYSMFAPLGYSLSVDRYLLKKKQKNYLPQKEEWPMIWAVRAMQLNFIAIYVFSLPNKLADDIAWINGDAIYLSMVSSMWSRQLCPEFFYLFDGLFSKIATYGTILIEATFPILVWFPRTRMFSLLALAFLHISIAVVLNGVAFFTLAMVCGLITFIPQECIKRVFVKFNWSRVFCLN